MKRENRVLESFKSLNENRLRLAQEEAKKIEEQAASRESFKDNYYAIREMKARKEKTRSMLMEAARNDAFATAIKAIYITALEAETLSDDNLILAESMVDKWIEESGGASKILGKVGNKTYLLSRITQIVEDAAQDSVKEIEAPEEDEEKQPTKKQMKNDAVDAAKDFIKNSNKKDLKDFVNQVIDSIQNTAEDKGEEKAAEKAEKEEENKEEAPAEDKGEEKPEDAPVEENEETPKEDNSEEEKESQEVEKDIESDSEELKDIENDEETEQDIEDDFDDANDDPKDIELDVPAEDDEVKATDSENGTPNTDIEDEEDSEDSDDSDDDSLNVSFDDDDDSDGETEDIEDMDDDDLGEPLDDDGIDNDITVDGDTESNGKVFDDLDKEEDVQKAIDLIRSRVADAEETFIRNNAEDKKKIDELLTKISTNVKTVEDLSDKDSVKSEMALESARINKRKIDAVRENRPLTIFEKMTRNLTKNIIKNSEVTESYLTEAGKLDIDHVVESAKVMYGFLETVNTLKLESVDEKYIEKVLEDMN